MATPVKAKYPSYYPAFLQVFVVSDTCGCCLAGCKTTPTGCSQLQLCRVRDTAGLDGGSSQLSIPRCRGRPYFIIPANDLAIDIAAGPSNTMKIAGKMKNTIGMIILITALWAISSAFWRLRSLICSA